MESISKRIVREGLTFDDVLVIPAYSEVLPHQVNIESRFTTKIPLKIPFISAAMDTVTEAEMAIAMAQEGGIGVIHKNMPAEEQARMIKKVKRAESGMIRDPVTLREDAVVSDALRLMQEFSIGGIPVVNASNQLVGIITNRDLRFEKNLSKPVREVMTGLPLITVNHIPELDEAERILHAHRIEKLPVINENQELIGLVTYKDILKARQRPQSNKDELGRLRVAAAIGTGNDSEKRLQALVDAGVDAIVVDTAHGHSAGVIRMVKQIRKKFPHLQIVAGNIATGEAAIALADAGANAIKVGIGPGSICTTRVVAGIGMPQLSAIMDVSEKLKPIFPDVCIIADGGIRFSGDVVKAIAAGADSVMLGSLFAGTEESPGETILYEGRKFKNYRGMGSIDAMQQGSRDRYFQADETDARKLVPEGIVGRVPYKGSISEVIYQLQGGLRAGMGYCGAAHIRELQKAAFVRITNASVLESHPHDVIITREAPNYTRP